MFTSSLMICHRGLLWVTARADWCLEGPRCPWSRQEILQGLRAGSHSDSGVLSLEEGPGLGGVTGLRAGLESGHVRSLQGSRWADEGSGEASQVAQGWQVQGELGGMGSGVEVRPSTPSGAQSCSPGWERCWVRSEGAAVLRAVGGLGHGLSKRRWPRSYGPFSHTDLLLVTTHMRCRLRTRQTDVDDTVIYAEYSRRLGRRG